MVFLFLKLDHNLLLDRAKSVHYVHETIKSTVPRMVSCENKSVPTVHRYVKFNQPTRAFLGRKFSLEYAPADNIVRLPSGCAIASKMRL